ncbi:MAG TPA: ABC transporter permease [Clostridia bacterium]|nr:ABC transporter permease [Clostridia bacterium]
MVINKKIARTMLESKSRYIGSFLLILISCALFTAFKLSLPSIIKSVDEFRKACEVEDANFIVSVPLNNIKELEKKYNLVLEERKSLDYAIGDSTLRLLKETKKLDRYSVIKGSPLNKPNDMLIFDKYAKNHNLIIGSTLKVGEKEFRITGYFTEPDYLYVLNSETDLLFNYEKFGIAVVPASGFDELQGAQTFYSVKFSKGNVKEFKDAIRQSSMIIKWIDSDINPRINAFDGDISGTVQLGDILPLFILVITCFLLAVVIWRLLKGEFVQIGTLYALGYRKKEIMKHYLAYSVIICLIGSILGIITGMLFIKPLIITQSFQYNLPVIHVDYNIFYLITAFILPFLFLVPATMFVVMKALRMPPLLLMRGGGDGKKVGFIEKRLKLGRFGFNTKFKIREIVRNIPRSLIMIMGVSLAAILLLFGFIMQYSIDNLMKDGYNKVYRYKYVYMLNTLETGKPDKGEAISMSTFSAKDSSGKKLHFKIQGMQRGSGLIDIKDKNGGKLDFKQNIMTKTLADRLGIKAQDTVKVENKFTGKVFKVSIDKIADTYIGNFIYIPLDSYNKLNGFPENSYTGILSSEKLSIDSGKLLTTISKKDIIEGYESTIGVFKVFTLVITAVACCIGLIIIFIVTSLLIEENKANISLLKILGYSKKRIYSLILNSTAVLVVIGFIISVPVAVFLMDRMFETITSNMDITVPVGINWVCLVACFIIIVVTYEVSKLLSRRKIINISMADSLKSRAE